MLSRAAYGFRVMGRRTRWAPGNPHFRPTKTRPNRARTEADRGRNTFAGAAVHGGVGYSRYRPVARGPRTGRGNAGRLVACTPAGPTGAAVRFSYAKELEATGAAAQAALEYEKLVKTALAPEAYRRGMEIWLKLGRAGRVRQLGQDYLKAFPAGPTGPGSRRKCLFWEPVLFLRCIGGLERFVWRHVKSDRAPRGACVRLLTWGVLFWTALGWSIAVASAQTDTSPDPGSPVSRRGAAPSITFEGCAEDFVAQVKRYIGVESRLREQAVPVVLRCAQAPGQGVRAVGAVRPLRNVQISALDQPPRVFEMTPFVAREVAIVITEIREAAQSRQAPPAARNETLVEAPDDKPENMQDVPKPKAKPLPESRDRAGWHQAVPRPGWA